MFVIAQTSYAGNNLLQEFMSLASYESTSHKSDHNDEPPSVGEYNIIAIHDSTSKKYEKKCTKCHADIHTRQSLDPSIPDAHVAMLPFAPGKPNDDKKCVWCHRSVDLVQAAGSPKDAMASLRKHVDSRTCTLCHGPGGEAKQFYQANFNTLHLSGSDMYGLVCSGCHGNLSNSKVRGENAAKIQKAIQKNKGGMAPLGALTTDQILAIANALQK
jgi:cytochrome c5